jgi:hypothetical protein
LENHHNFAWKERHVIGGVEREVIVHRKGATPAGAGVLLTGPQIESAVKQGDIVIRPFRKRQLTPNSYDFRLGNRCCVYTAKTLDAAKENRFLDVCNG